MANDSVDTVAERISASPAGVEASVEPGGAELVQKMSGAGQEIRLGEDSSGFTVLTGLAAAELEPGRDPDPVVPMASVPSLAEVRAGELVVGDVKVEVDPERDSLIDVLDRISESPAQVDARVFASSGEVRLRASDGQDLALTSDSSGLLEALDIPLGRFESADIRGRLAAGGPGDGYSRSA